MGINRERRSSGAGANQFQIDAARLCVWEATIRGLWDSAEALVGPPLVMLMLKVWVWVLVLFVLVAVRQGSDSMRVKRSAMDTCHATLRRKDLFGLSSMVCAFRFMT